MAETAKSSPLFTESPLAILVVDPRGHVMNINPAGCKDLARPRARVVDTPLIEWVLPGDRSRVEEGLSLVLEGTAGSWKARIRRGDGLARIQEFLAAPLRKEGGVEGALIFLRDMTEGGAGRPDTVQLQTLLENLPGQFVLVTDKAGRIRHSSGLGRTHYRDNSSVLGAPYQELLGHERDGEANLEDLLRTVGAGKSWSGVQWHRKMDGASFPAEVFASPHLDPRSGQVLGGLVVGRDITAIRKWKEQAQRSEPLAQIGSLTARIAQEMGKAVDRLEAALPRGHMGGGGTEGGAGQERQHQLRVEMGRLRTFLSGVSEFGNRGNLRCNPVSLPDLTDEALERCGGRLGSLGIQPTAEVPPNLPHVFADQRYLARILDILLDNALDALEGVPNPFLKVDLRNGADGVLLRMTNSGSAVQEDWLEEIFDPFFTTREGRPGLGLAVARGMITAHEGRIWAEIPQGGFLTVVLELPREAPERIREFRPAPLNLSRLRTVLVVDDDETVRLAMRAFLEKVGYQVREAWSGRSALAQLTTGRLPEILITDLRMADGSGYWFLEELERAFPRLVRRTVIVTGDADHEAASELTARTGCPLVRKPFELPHLLEVLDQVSLKS